MLTRVAGADIVSWRDRDGVPFYLRLLANCSCQFIPSVRPLWKTVL